ncbi:MAG: hypothetical protein KTR16_08705 [Acidiferrobacterales bacterium]|nr:hypothetical protein [Acidiferrobacterales bacterium]
MALLRLKNRIDRILANIYHRDELMNRLIQAKEIEKAINAFECEIQT